jgi:hypothetical protein
VRERTERRCVSIVYQRHWFAVPSGVIPLGLCRQPIGIGLPASLVEPIQIKLDFAARDIDDGMLTSTKAGISRRDAGATTVVDTYLPVLERDLMHAKCERPDERLFRRGCGWRRVDPPQAWTNVAVHENRFVVFDQDRSRRGSRKGLFRRVGIGREDELIDQAVVGPGKLMSVRGI